MRYFRLRRKGQHRDYDAFPFGTFLFVKGDRLVKHDGDKLSDAGASVTVLGQFRGYDSGGQRRLFERLDVRLDNGWHVPCYRRADPGHNFAVCQDFTRKGYQEK